jgi:small subunit ribosomal protein S6
MYLYTFFDLVLNPSLSFFEEDSSFPCLTMVSDRYLFALLRYRKEPKIREMQLPPSWVHEEEHMRRYETIYILRPNLGEEAINTIIDNTNAIIANEGGTIIHFDRWGLRKLAYLIKKESQGLYILCDYATEPAAVLEMERKFRIDDSVLKYMTIKLADDISPEKIEQAKVEMATRKAAKESGSDGDAEEVEGFDIDEAIESDE